MKPLCHLISIITSCFRGIGSQNGKKRGRYKGWLSTLIATARAYNTYQERMSHKPEELDIVEWHYLLKYFRIAKFQVCSTLIVTILNNRKF